MANKDLAHEQFNEKFKIVLEEAKSLGYAFKAESDILLAKMFYIQGRIDEAESLKSRFILGQAISLN